MKKLATMSVLLLLSACGNLKEYRHVPTYHTDNAAPVIFVHGLFASKIRSKNTGEELWPGPITNFLHRTSSFFAIKIDNDLKPNLDLEEAFAFYNGIFTKKKMKIWQLLARQGYTQGIVHRKYDDKRKYYFFVYDWRKDLVQISGELDNYIDQIRKDYDDPTLKVNIVAMSLGGNIVKYYQAYGSEDVLYQDSPTPTRAGEQKLDKVIFIAPPLQGSVLAMKALIEGYNFGLLHANPESVMALASLYELLPTWDWLQDAYGRPIDIDTFDISTWWVYAWSIYDPKVRNRVTSWEQINKLESYLQYHLQRGKKFVKALEGYKSHNEEHYFFSNCKETPYKAEIKEHGKIDFRADTVSGDGVVPYPQNATATVCSGHRVIFLQPDVVKGVVETLLAPTITLERTE